LKFDDLIGMTKLQREAEAGENATISISDSVELQRRRTLKLALTLSKKLDVHLDASLGEDMSLWGDESIELSHYSFGKELLRLVGTAYVASELSDAWLFSVLLANSLHQQQQVLPHGDQIPRENPNRARNAVSRCMAQTRLRESRAEENRPQGGGGGVDERLEGCENQ